MALVHCPICKRSFLPQESAAMPFCSRRCQQIDLGRWLDEKNTVPAPHRDGEYPADGGDDDRV